MLAIVGLLSFELDGLRQNWMSSFGGVPEWPKGSDCKSDGSAYVGSNPTPSTMKERSQRHGMLRGYSSVVEPQPSKLMARVRSPLPAPAANAHIAQQVEHFLGKEEAIGSSPIVSTNPLRVAFLKMLRKGDLSQN